MRRLNGNQNCNIRKKPKKNFKKVLTEEERIARGNEQKKLFEKIENGDSEYDDQQDFTSNESPSIIDNQMNPSMNQDQNYNSEQQMDLDQQNDEGNFVQQEQPEYNQQYYQSWISHNRGFLE